MATAVAAASSSYEEEATERLEKERLERSRDGEPCCTSMCVGSDERDAELDASGAAPAPGSDA